MQKGPDHLIRSLLEEDTLLILYILPAFPTRPVVSNLGQVLLDNYSSPICFVSSSGGAMIPTLWMRKLRIREVI